MAGQALAMMPWFPRDFLASTRGWRILERAIYRELLDAQWEQGTLPDDPEELARTCGATDKEFAAAWKRVSSKFVPADGGGLMNLRLEEHRAKALRIRERRAAGAEIVNAKRGAQRPAKRDGERDPERPAERDGQRAHPSPSPSPSCSPLRSEQGARAGEAADEVPRGTPGQPYREHWRTVQAKYPPNPIRENWIGAERNALRLVESGQATWPDLVAGVERYAAARRADGLSVMNPEKFFGAEDQPWAQAWPVTQPARAARGGLAPGAEKWGEGPEEDARAVG